MEYVADIVAHHHFTFAYIKRTYKRQHKESPQALSDMVKPLGGLCHSHSEVSVGNCEVKFCKKKKKKIPSLFV